MRQLFPLILFYFISHIGIAQSYFSMIDTTSIWRDEVGGGHDGIMDVLNLEEFSIGKDTFFNGYQYFELKETIQEINCCWVADPAVTYPVSYYVREDSLKHVFISNTFSEELFYDFNLEVGDTLPYSTINTDFNNFVISIDSILIGSDYRRRFNIGNHDDWEDEPYASIIEGIGSTNGLRIELLPPFESYNQLICFTNQGYTTQLAEQYYGIAFLDDNISECDLIYVEIKNEIDPSNQITISPNPVTEEINISTTGNDIIDSNLKIMNQQGEIIIQKQIVLLSNSKFTEKIIRLPAGIYFLKISGTSVNYNYKFVVL